jgi:hypothetical protein
VSPLRSATALQNRHGLQRFRELLTDLAEAGKGTSMHTLIGGRKKLFEKKFSRWGHFGYVGWVKKTFLHDIQAIFRIGPFRRIAESH